MPMTTYNARILLDSITDQGYRLTTAEITIPRIVLADFNTHRALSRNSASSRAIPVKRQLERAANDGFVPTYWGANQPGMQAEKALTPEDAEKAAEIWNRLKGEALVAVQQLADLGVHKQLANRLLEPWQWHTIVLTATDFDNLIHLRDHGDAQPELQKTIHLLKEARALSTPRPVSRTEWHMPLVMRMDGSIDVEDMQSAMQLAEKTHENVWAVLRRVSAGRCARVSYLTHDGRRDLLDDLKLYERLVTAGHMSPTEHVARPMTAEECAAFMTKRYVPGGEPVDSGPYQGNFQGWIQLRKTIPREWDALG